MNAPQNLQDDESDYETASEGEDLPEDPPGSANLQKKRRLRQINEDPYSKNAMIPSDLDDLLDG